MDGRGLLVFVLLGLPTPAVLRHFFFVNELKTWREAQIYCRENYDDLATIETPNDWTRVSELVANSGHSAAWIGLYSWRWSLDNTSLNQNEMGSWFIFHAGQSPNGTHCGERFSGKVRRYDCGYHQAAICYDETTNNHTLAPGGMTWHAARDHCRQTYTDLAIIRDEQEYNYIMSMGNPDAYYWIGLHREGWTWSDLTDCQFHVWKSGEPTGGGDTCVAAGVDGMFDDTCATTHPIICAAKKMRRVLKVTLKTDGSVDLNDPMVQESAQQQVEEDLKRRGAWGDRLQWRTQPHGDVFTKPPEPPTSPPPCP